MAAGLKAIRKRIQSVKNTQKITRAMKMVAASRLRKAQNTMLAIRRYADELRKLAALVSHRIEGIHPLMTPQTAVRAEMIVVVSGDRGLCGSFNANIVRQVKRRMERLSTEGVTPHLLFVGRKGAEAFRRLPVPQETVFTDLLHRLTSEQVTPLVEFLARGYLRGDYDRVVVVFNRFRSTMAQEIAETQVFPLTENIFAPQEVLGDEARRDLIFEPDAAAIAAYLVPHFAATELYHDLMESVASELAARMNAMEAATKNAIEMAGRLTVAYNKARQNAITAELMDIVGGAEALGAGRQ